MPSLPTHKISIKRKNLSKSVRSAFSSLKKSKRAERQRAIPAASSAYAPAEARGGASSNMSPGWFFMDDIQNELRKLEEETFRRSSIMTDWKTPLEEEEEEESTDDDDSYSR